VGRLLPQANGNVTITPVQLGYFFTIAIAAVERSMPYSPQA